MNNMNGGIIVGEDRRRDIINREGRGGEANQPVGQSILQIIHRWFGMGKRKLAWFIIGAKRG
jgi:hypothetical protein